jgi:N-acetylhexosamine 1-kinase
MVMICKTIVKKFLPYVEEFHVAPLGSGLIHRTYLVTTKEGSASRPAPYVFQELNSNVFRDPHSVMSNIMKVQSALCDYPEPTLTFLPRVDGDGYLAADGTPQRFWRCAHHFPDTVTYDTPPAPAYLKAAAKAFAQFGQRLSALDCDEFHPTIPRFHDTPHRYETFQRAWHEAGDERKSVEEYETLVKLANAFPELGLGGLMDEQVPQGVSHNDTKLNNCLFHADKPEVVCVIDLDTVMAGSWLLDFGDLSRTAVCALPEDTQDLQAINIDEHRFEAVASGYIEVLRDSMAEAEKERMVYAAFLMTYELALRFFTDHLQNDAYFGVKVPHHNLIRARSQIRLAECFLEQRNHLESVVRRALGKRTALVS